MVRGQGAGKANGVVTTEGSVQLVGQKGRKASSTGLERPLPDWKDHCHTVGAFGLETGSSMQLDC